MITSVFSYWASTDFLDDEETYRRALRIIPSYRAEKAQKFAFEKDRKLSIAAWLLLVEALDNMDIAVDGKNLEFNEFGKPSIEGGPFFNLSHSGTIVICSVCPECPVGCDVEIVGEFKERLARYCMQPEEVDAMLALPEAKRAGEFYRRWTLKESYMKAHGKGLSIPPQSFAIDYSSDGVPHVRDDETCALVSFPCLDVYHLAACALDQTAQFKPMRRIVLA